MIRVADGVTGVIIEDDEIDAYQCGASITSQQGNANNGLQILRNNIYGSADYIVWGAGALIQNNYGHDRQYQSDTYCDAFQTVVQSNDTIDHSTFIVEGSSAANGVVSIDNEGDEPSSVPISNNLLSGANFLIDAVPHSWGVTEKLILMV